MSDFLRHRLQLPDEPASGNEDDVLVAVGLALASAVDGGLDDEEAAYLDALADILPDWYELARSAEFDDAVDAHLTALQKRFLAEHDEDDAEPVELAMFGLADLANIKSPGHRARCFVLCTELALAAGGIEPDEDRFLAALVDILKLDADFVDKTVEVLAVKYGCV